MTKQQDSKQLKEIKTLIESIEVYYYNDVTNEIMAKIKKLIKLLLLFPKLMLVKLPANNRTLDQN